MTSGFEFWKFLHVLAAILWIGGGYALLLANVSFSRAHNAAGKQAVVVVGDALSKTTFAIMPPVVIVTGIIMVATTSLSFGAAWVTIGFVGVVASGILGGVFLNRTSTQMGEVVAAEGHDAPRAVALDRRLRILSMVDLVILTVVVWAMVAKPGA